MAALIHLRIDGAEVTDRRMTLRRRSDAGRVLPASTVATQRLVAAVVAPAAGVVPAAVVVPAPGRPGRPERMALASEMVALDYGNAFDFPVHINRCGVLAGASQFGKADQGIFSFWLHSWRAKRRRCLWPR